MNSTKIATDNHYSPGHFVVGELQPDGSFRAYASLTKHAVTPDNEVNPYVKLLLSNHDLFYNTANKQYFVIFKKPITLKPGTFDTNKSLGDSATILETDNVKPLLEAVKHKLELQE